MNILDLVHGDGTEVKRVAATKGGEFAGPCPLCGGKDRFRVWPEKGEGGRYWCRGCGKSGDLIQYLRDYRRMNFQEACSFLGRELPPPSSLAGKRPEKPSWEPRATISPGDLWQAKARAMMTDASYHLWQPTGARMLGWLTEKRGLTVESIKAASLGFLPVARWETAPTWGLESILKDDGSAKKLWFPKGLTIPLCHGSQVLRLRIRRPKSDGDPRYYLVRGSDTRAMILGNDRPVSILVESELDALLLHQQAGDLVNVISLGNAQTRPDQAVAEILNQSQLILIALDADQAGAAEFWRWWKEHYPQSRRWPPVAGKDPGDMLVAGVNIRTWVEAGLTEYKDVTAQPEQPLPLAGAEEELVVEEHHEPAPPSPPATCKLCPWHELNPWSHAPALGAWCHYRMEPLAADSPACEEFRRGEVSPRQPHKRVPAVPVTTSPASQERILLCCDCHHFEANHGPNPRQAWGRCLKRRRGRFGCARACEKVFAQEDVSNPRVPRSLKAKGRI